MTNQIIILSELQIIHTITQMYGKWISHIVVYMRFNGFNEQVHERYSDDQVFYSETSPHIPSSHNNTTKFRF